MKSASPNLVVKTVSFAEALALFETQLDAPAYPHRPRVRAQSNAHITGVSDEAPSTQAVLQAVYLCGPAGSTQGARCILIDGYARFANWKKNGACPFDQLVVIIHMVTAQTREAALDKIDVLESTIDSVKSVKRNAHRWTAAVKTSLQPHSNAYKIGRNANSYLRRTLGDASEALSVLSKNAKRKQQSHQLMDELYSTVEREFTSTERKTWLNPGFAEAIFIALTDQPELFEDIRWAIRGAARPMPPEALTPRSLLIKNVMCGLMANLGNLSVLSQADKERRRDDLRDNLLSAFRFCVKPSLKLAA